MRNASIYWHDYETSGTDPRRDRAVQFAGQRTTLDLEPLGEPLSILCKPAPDVLPQPAACLVTGIAPQDAQRAGLIEAEFSARIQDELGAPGTCGAGFNSIRFDDEFTRNLLYRNFYDPYEREWKDGNSRWDIIDLARMCYALRPQGIEWPRGGENKPSFKLQDLAAANDLSSAQAHDAASDVATTIDLARRLRRAQPRLWDFYFALRDKNRARALLDVTHRAPVLHVSSRYPAERGCLAMVMPLTQHPDQQNKVIVYDLDVDPAPLLELDPDEIADRVFTARADLPDDIARIPLKAVSINKSPALAPLSALKDVDFRRIGLDVALCEKHLEALRRVPDIAEKVRRVFAMEHEARTAVDPELAIYAGFAADADRRLFAKVRGTPPASLREHESAFRDSRFSTLLFRYRARNFPQTLDPDERMLWEDFRRARLTESTALTSIALYEYFAQIAALRAAPTTTVTQHALLDRLDDWGHHIAAQISHTTAPP
ncbi:MAG: exodeoxyribonuclease I [Xanthomonadaceae bacterium]|nr:exodeoxyribonuclease I [Xanthomonadaceae bacterium]MDE1961806.1 exodeoxyribonuclease I [Xanthomonadaceae bacterium]MDE2084477.1 exodeoxyribonuclease I [Xanthomonadaceae bacterium]MDE2258652.1 exodeoxyribonuclease I [Xanthomonadaceae bacterium]